MTLFRKIMLGAGQTSFGVFEYTATSKITVRDELFEGVSIIAHTYTYSGGVGRIICDGPITCIQGQLTFQNNDKVTSVSIPDSVVKMCGTFRNCPNLTKVNVNNLSVWLGINFTDADSNPLNEGAKLYINGEEFTEWTVNRSIKDYAFFGCSSIKTLFPSDNASPISIGKYAFSQCSALTDVTLSNIEWWGDYCFSGIPADTIYHNGDMNLIYWGEDYSRTARVKVNGNIITSPIQDFGGTCLSNTDIVGNVHLSEGIKLESMRVNFTTHTAFEDCTLNTITVSSVYLDQYAFSGSTIEVVNIEDFTSWMESTTRSSLYADYLIENAKTVLIEGKEIPDQLLIPESITSITDAIFMDFPMKSIKTLGNITDIGINPFAGCKNLEYVDFSNQTVVPTLSEYKTWKYGSRTTIVPDALYDEWITTGLWSQYTNYIIKKSDWDAQQVSE